DLQVQSVAVQHGRGVHAKLVLELAVTLLEVETPGLLAVEINAGQFTRAGEEPDVAAIRARRCRRSTPLVAAGMNRQGAEVDSPEFLAVNRNAEADDFLVDLGRQKDPLTPDRGRRRPDARQRQLPHDVRLLIPFRGQVFFRADAVVVRAAPLWPI